MKKQSSKYDYTAQQLKLFRSGKISGYQKTVFSLIDRLIFAREMHSIDLWKQSSNEASDFCRSLAAGRYISTLEARYLYNFIIENAKRRSP